MHGINQIIDGSTPYCIFASYIEAYESYINHIKFGWGSSIIDPEIKLKIELLKSKSIGFSPGGTLFEYFYNKKQLNKYNEFLRLHNFEWVELSRGTICIKDSDYYSLIKEYSAHYKVLSEIGYKSAINSDNMSTMDWVSGCERSLEAGASLVIIEARETGTAGIIDRNGLIKSDIIKELLTNIAISKIIFEAPTKQLQSYLINNYGSSVNMGNISFENILPLEALRRNLRSDTLNHRSR